MAEKKEAVPPPAAAPAPEAAADAAGKPAKAPSPIVPIIAAVVLAPALSWAVTNFVMMPQLKKQLAENVSAHGEAADPHAPEAAPAAAEGGEKSGGHGEKGGEPAGAANTYQFENVVVNLAGTMGTRYLKSSFMISGKDMGLRAAFESNKAKLVDTTLNTLSSLSLPDLEEVGSRNMIRERLIAAYNQVLGKRIVDQIYFSDFVVQ